MTAVLETAVPAGSAPAPAERRGLAVTALLNAPTGVLEEIRGVGPEAHHRVRSLALAILADD